MSSFEVGPMAGNILDALLHLPAVVTVQVVLSPPPVV